MRNFLFVLLSMSSFSLAAGIEEDLGKPDAVTRLTVRRNQAQVEINNAIQTQNLEIAEYYVDQKRAIQNIIDIKNQKNPFNAEVRINDYTVLFNHATRHIDALCALTNPSSPIAASAPTRTPFVHENGGQKQIQLPPQPTSGHPLGGFRFLTPAPKPMPAVSGQKRKANEVVVVFPAVPQTTYTTTITTCNSFVYQQIQTQQQIQTHQQLQPKADAPYQRMSIVNEPDRSQLAYSYMMYNGRIKKEDIANTLGVTSGTVQRKTKDVENYEAYCQGGSASPHQGFKEFIRAKPIFRFIKNEDIIPTNPILKRLQELYHGKPMPLPGANEQPAPKRPRLDGRVSPGNQG